MTEDPQRSHNPVFEVFGRSSRASVRDGAPERAPSACAWPGCTEAGAYRAPRSRDRLSDYQWFCLEHVRIYNRSWNYYRGMSDAQVEAHIRSDTTWNRPSWPFGGSGPKVSLDDIGDPFGLFGGQSRPAPHTPQLSASDRKALGVLELEPSATFEEVKARYKELVKRHHPDANNGAKDAEERLKRINEAFDTLKTGLFAQT